MKTISVKSFFKKVSAEQAKRSPALGDKIGVKRVDLEWSFSGYDAADVSEAPANIVAYFLNKAIEDFGRSLITDNSEDWSYAPSRESLTLQAAYDAATAETSRARTLTKVTASHFAAFYGKHAPALIEIKEAAAIAAQSVIVDWTTYSKKENFRTAMYARLRQFAEAVMSLEDDNQIMADFVESEHDLPAVLDALIKAFSEAETVAITADAL